MAEEDTVVVEEVEEVEDTAVEEVEDRAMEEAAAADTVAEGKQRNPSLPLPMVEVEEAEADMEGDSKKCQEVMPPVIRLDSLSQPIILFREEEEEEVCPTLGERDGDDEG